MKRSYGWAALAMGLGLTLALMWLLSGGALFSHADSPHHVAPNCTGVPAPCHTSLQDAVERIRSVRTDYAACGAREQKNVISQMTDYVLPKCMGL